MKAPFFALLLLGSIASAPAADLVALGHWSEDINAQDLISGAGSGLQNPESTAGIITLSISNPLVTYRVRARLSSGSWNGNVGLWIKRASAGSGLGTITGGTSYVQLTNSDTEIFSGTLDRSSVSLQLKTTGLTTAVSSGTYQSPVIFTVVSP